MIRPIITRPGEVLAELTGVAEPVVEFGPELQQLAVDLTDTCDRYRGYGLAAPQIGVNRRVVYINDRIHDPIVLVNPVWVPASIATTAFEEEGCLSLPGLHVKVERPDSIEVQALTVNREPLQFTARGLHARIIQHECDHLEGTLIIDALKGLNRRLALDTFRKASKRVLRRETV